MIFVWVEGADDKRFVEQVLKPRLKTKFSAVTILEYATMKNRKVSAFMDSIDSIGAEYLFIADLDEGNCRAGRKVEVITAYPGVAADRVALAVNEIESWFAAGVPVDKCEDIGLELPANCESLTKEAFNELIPAAYRGARVEYMLELLADYSLDQGSARSPSLAYLRAKVGI